MWASAPTGCIRFNGPCRTPCGAVKDAGPYVHNNRRCIPAVYDDTVCGSMWTSTPTGCVRITDHPIDQTTGGAGGPLALSPQQCEAWIEGVTAPIQWQRTKPLKNLKSQNLKVLLDFFQKIVGSRGKAPVARRNGRNPPGGGLPYCSGSQKLRFRSTPPSMPETVPSLVYCHIWKS